MATLQQVRYAMLSHVMDAPHDTLKHTRAVQRQ